MTNESSSSIRDGVYSVEKRTNARELKLKLHLNRRQLSHEYGYAPILTAAAFTSVRVSCLLLHCLARLV